MRNESSNDSIANRVEDPTGATMSEEIRVYDGVVIAKSVDSGIVKYGSGPFKGQRLSTRRLNVFGTTPGWGIVMKADGYQTGSVTYFPKDKGNKKDTSNGLKEMLGRMRTQASTDNPIGPIPSILRIQILPYMGRQGELDFSEMKAKVWDLKNSLYLSNGEIEKASLLCLNEDSLEVKTGTPSQILPLHLPSEISKFIQQPITVHEYRDIPSNLQEEPHPYEWPEWHARNSGKEGTDHLKYDPEPVRNLSPSQIAENEAFAKERKKFRMEDEEFPFGEIRVSETLRRHATTFLSRMLHESLFEQNPGLRILPDLKKYELEMGVSLHSGSRPK